MNKDLIISTAIGYKFQSMELFLKSLDKVYTGNLLLFTYKIKKLPNYSFQVIIENINTNYYKSSLPYDLNSPHNKRLFYSYKYLSDHPEYNRILLTDVRDVLFQEDPFLCILDNKLQVAMEEIKIGENEYNSGWIKVLKGEEYLEKHKDKLVSCCGTVLGQRNNILFYLNYLTEFISTNDKKLDTNKSIFFMDQGCHNIFIIEYPHLICKHVNNIGKIFTMSYPGKIILSRSGLFINDYGLIYSIVHQYDRYKFLTDMMKDYHNIIYFSDFKKTIKKFMKKCLIKVL